MSGHSKWSTIKHQKAAEDQKRGKVFSKLAKAISVAVREGSSDDPETNAKLRLAITQAKQANMPKENIKRAIDKGAGRGEGGVLETIVYEGFGPEKTAIVVECVTDNRNRTGSEIKSFFDKSGGSLGAPGSAKYLFDQKGLIVLKKDQDSEEQILKLIDLGIDDVEEDGGVIEVYTRPAELEEIKQKIESSGFSVEQSGLVLKAKTVIRIDDENKKQKVLKFLNSIDNLDDVQKVYCNADFI